MTACSHVTTSHRVTNSGHRAGFAQALRDSGLKPAQPWGPLPPGPLPPPRPRRSRHQPSRLSVTQLWWHLATLAAHSYDSPASASRGQGTRGLPLPLCPPSSPPMEPRHPVCSPSRFPFPHSLFTTSITIVCSYQKVSASRAGIVSVLVMFCPQSSLQLELNQHLLNERLKSWIHELQPLPPFLRSILPSFCRS